MLFFRGPLARFGGGCPACLHPMMHWLHAFKRNPFVVPMVLVAGLALFFVSEGSYWQSADRLNDLRDTSLKRQYLSRLERALDDAEIAQRGYLLTGRLSYLEPYEDGRRISLETLDALELSFRTDDGSAIDVAALRTLAQDRLLELQTTVQLLQSGQAPAARELFLSDSRAQSMAAIRALAGKLVDEQLLHRDHANHMLDRTLLLSRYGVAALSVVLVAFLLLYLRKSDALAEANDTQKQVMQGAQDRLEAEVAQRTAELTDLTRHVLNAREDERQRLARDLHDDLGSLLTAAKLDAARIKSRLGGQAPEALDRLADLVDKLNDAIALGRSIIEDLRPSTLNHLGLKATLGILASEFSLGSGIPVHARCDDVTLQPAVELVIYRIVQEAITNLSKYAQATEVWIDLHASAERAGHVDVSVRDNGVGFDGQLGSRSSYGLLGMRFRVEAEGGSLRVQSRPGHGTLIHASLPMLLPAA